MSHKYRRSRPKVFCKTDVYKSFKVRKKAPVPEFCFENTARRRLFKNRLRRRCFPVSFANFLRNNYFEELRRMAAYFSAYENKLPATKG